MNDAACRRRTLAASDFMLVEQCSCGSAARGLVLRNAFTPIANASELS